MKYLSVVKLLLLFFSAYLFPVVYAQDNSLLSINTQIISTLGPSTFRHSDDLLLYTDIVRLNFSHGLQSDHKSRRDYVMNWSNNTGKKIEILADLQGPKIRLGSFKNNEITLNTGDKFILTTDMSKEGDQTKVGVDYPDLVKDVNINDILVIGDGIINLKVIDVVGNTVICEALNQGVLSNRKGINKFGGGFSAPSLTEKDKGDLLFALNMSVDYIAISFVKTRHDVQVVKDLIKQYHKSTKVIAKIETKEAIDNIEEIASVADLLMVARGDLGIELGIYAIPYMQKMIINVARNQCKPVITATQMMTSMIHNITPTRAEVADIANAVYDGTDMIMFSEETAVGDHPDLVVKVAKNICIAAESTTNQALFMKSKNNISSSP